ncbi:MAG: UvrB/UvrC motif-containing protein [Duncaniella sp.]|nr:UvrB/UvrC motif-containing protein [Duncaniella sp.]
MGEQDFERAAVCRDEEAKLKAEREAAKQADADNK